ncbi:Ribonucleoside-diphosphate reductase subunit alpha [Bienertia sinuspersici]
MNDYEKKRLATIEANKKKMACLGIKRIASSMTSLVESTKAKKKGRSNARREDDEYVPDNDELEDEECEKESQVVISKKAKTKNVGEGNKKGNFIPPMSIAKFMKMNKKEQQAMAMNIVQKAISSQPSLDDNEEFEEDVLEEENDQEIRVTMEDDTDTEAYYDQEGPIGQGVGLEDACPHDLDIEPVNEREVMNIEEEGELNNSGTTRKRGTVYCRKLTMLPPEEKLNVEFDEDGNAIGPHASLFSFFLGQQVRNKSVCPVQVKGWDEYTSETLDHLWACVKEKCSFDDPEYRRESVMKHAQRLFRDARSKLKRKYFNDTRLKTKEERLKNKPSEMTKIEWKFLVDHWSDEKFKRQKNEGKCSRVDVLVASRTRKSKKAVNVLALEKNTLVVDEIKKLKEQRDQGLNDKTDEQIFQDVLGKDTHGYLRAYGPGKSITQHFKVKPSRLDLSQELIEVKKKADQLIEEARKDAENARMEAEKAKKEAEAIRNDVDRKIEQNNAIWEKKFHQLMNFIKGGTYSNDDVSGNESSS